MPFISPVKPINKAVIAAPGAVDAADVTYTPTTTADWPGTDPVDAQEGFDMLAGRVADIEAALPEDASVVTYSPADTSKWNGSADPGEVNEALDQLASRTKTLETAGYLTSVDASIVTYTPSTAGDWNGGSDPGDADDAFNQLASRTKTLESTIATYYDFIVDSAGDFSTAFDSGGTYAGKAIYVVPGTYTISSSTTLYFHSGMRIDWGTLGGGTYPGSSYNCNVAVSLGSGSGFQCKDGISSNNAYTNNMFRLDRTNSMTVANPDRITVDAAAAAPAAATLPASLVSGGSTPCFAVNGQKYPISTRDSNTQATLSVTPNREGLNTSVGPMLVTCFTDTLDNITMRGSLFLTSADLPSDSTPPFQLTGFNHDLSGFSLKIEHTRGYEVGACMARIRVIRSRIGPMEIIPTSKTVSAFSGSGTYYIPLFLIAGSQYTEFAKLSASELQLVNDVSARTGTLYMIDARLTSNVTLNVNLTMNEFNVGTGGTTATQGVDANFSYRFVLTGTYVQNNSSSDTATITTNTVNTFTSAFWTS